jgi:serine/threonine-protein kinase
MHPERLGEYIIELELGRGGMGTVYRARHAVTDQLAAVKVLPAEMARQPNFIERFQREIELLKRLEHPNIVRFYEAGESDGFHFYAMEFVDGQRLDHVIVQNRCLPWQTAVELTLPVCRALKHAHDNGIIHRDLKPSNLLIAHDGTVKLTDFGVAKVFDGTQLTATGGIIGTAEYMSPEQGEGKPVTPRSDLYSLGVVLYVMLTGRTPFSGNTPLDLIRQHRFSMFDTPRTVVPDLPRWMDELVCELMEKDPQKRPPNAQIVARRLESMLKKAQLSSGQTGLGDVATLVTIPTLTGPLPTGAGTLMQRMLRWRLKIGRPAWWEGLVHRLLVLVGLGVVLSGVVLFVRSRSEESRWRYILDQAAQVDELGSSYLEDLLNEFEARYPASPHREEAQQLREDAGRAVARRAFLRSRIVQDLRPTGEVVPDPVRLYRKALLQLWLESPEAARPTLRRVAASTDPNHALIASLAQEDLLMLDLEQAAHRQAAGQTAEASRICQQIVDKHGNDRRFKAAVTKARRILAEPPKKR